MGIKNFQGRCDEKLGIGDCLSKGASSCQVAVEEVTVVFPVVYVLQLYILYIKGVSPGLSANTYDISEVTN